MSIEKGIYAASMTVINKDLSVNIDSTIGHSERLIQQGCHGVVIGGSTGMSQLISSNEKRKLIDKMSISKFKDNFVFGTGATSEVPELKDKVCSCLPRSLLATSLALSLSNVSVDE